MSFTQEPKPSQVADFEQLLMTSLENFVNASKALGEPLSSLADKVVEAFRKTRDLIQYGLSHTEPPPNSTVLEFYFASVKEIVDMKESYKDDPFSNHFATVAAAIVGLGWISIKTAPVPFIRDMKEAGEYFSNRVLLRNKGDELHVNWVNKWNMLISDLQQYVAANFLTGFTWGSEMARRATAATAPPPPPPPPPPAEGGCLTDINIIGDGARQALLSSLNQGSDITRVLRPVNKEQAGTKQRGPVLVAHAPRQATIAKAPIRPAKFTLEGRKWIVENQKNNLGMTVNNDDMSQCLSMYNCEDSSLQVQNKMNSVVIDSCKRTCIVLKAIISSVELIRCDRVKIQLDDTVPLVNLDNCDSVQIFLTSNSRNVEVVSSKSNSCNVCLLQPDGDYKEYAMPEQIKTIFSGDRLVSSVLDKN